MRTYVPMSTVVPEGLWPEDLFSSEGGSFLDNLACLVYDDRGGDETFDVFVKAQVMAEARIDLPFLEGTSLVLGTSDNPEGGLIDVNIFGQFFPDAPPVIDLYLRTTVLSLELDRALFKPVDITEAEGAAAGSGSKLQVTPREGNVSIPLPFVVQLSYRNEEWSLEVELPAGEETSLSIPTCMIGESGVIFEAHNISFNFSGGGNRPSGTPAGWRGLYLGQVKVYVPDLFNGNVEGEDLGIGTGGFYGDLMASFALSYSRSASPRFTGDLVTELFGMEGGISSVSLSFTQNVPTEFAITGKVQLPFFEQAGAVDLEIGLDAEGAFTVGLAGDDGLATIEIENLLGMQLSSMAIELDKGIFTTRLSGKVTPLFGAPVLEWPTFAVKELSIDSEGNVRLEGGWLDLREQYSFDFKGFELEITKLGFGNTDDGGKWIGFSGGLKLAEGLPAGASVEGLRLTWYEDGRGPKLTFDGVGVEFEVPEVLSFKGAVSYSGRVDVDLGGGAIEHVERFDGAIKLDLKSLNMQVDGTLVVGSASGARGSYNFFAVYVGAELPAGIPLFGTGLALYGMAGLFALQMEPNRRAGEGWFENPDGTPGWYKRGEPGVTDLKTKWGPTPGSVAFGAGVTIGTLPDNGTTFHGKLLFVMVFPGPIIMLEGRGDLLKERAELDKKGAPTSDPLFRALAVLDNRAGNLTVGLDAQYKYAGGGELVDIRGGVEAFFDYRRADAWHLYLGQNEPRERRIRARTLSIFEANAYFMLDARRVAMGAWIGFNEHWSFGPLAVTLEAWIDGNAALSFKPPQFHGDLWVHGKVELKVFGFGIGLTADARIAADVFKPFHLLGEFSVKLDLPWPLPDPSATVRLEWGPERVLPPLPLPLKEIAVEHLKVTTSWPLPRNRLLLPDYDRGDGFLKERPLPTPNEIAPPPADLPLVPMDCRPHITFGRHVNDDARVGANVQPDVWERIGDPARNEGPVNARYSLSEVALEKWIPDRVDPSKGVWDLVARAPETDGKAKLYGSWAPVPPAPETQGAGAIASQTKLWLWSKTPFDYSRHTGRAYEEWFTESSQDYPCLPALPDLEVCNDFEGIDPEEELRSPFSFPDRPGLLVSWDYPETQSVYVVQEPVAGLTRALRFAENVESDVAIYLPEPAKAVRLVVVQAGAEVRATGYDAQGESYGPFFGGTAEDPHLEVRGEDLVRVVLSQGAAGYDTRIFRVCTVTGAPEREVCSNFDGVEFGRFFMPGDFFPGSAEEIFLSEIADLPDRLAWVVELQTELPFSHALLVTFMPTLGRRATPARLETKRAVISIGLKTPAQAVRVTLGNPRGVEATGYDADGRAYGPFSSEGGKPYVEVLGKDLVKVSLSEGEVFGLTIVEVCALQARDLNRHLSAELARWTQEGEVLEPYTTYRLRTVTGVEARGVAELAGRSRVETLREYAYFQTDGPPGIRERGAGGGEIVEQASGLEDLTRYVKHTVPDTVPAAGEKPSLPRPVYRAYDVGVRFNEDYVELMYRLAGRDLGLYLYDNNDLPVRDAEGRLLVLSNRWGRAEEATLTEGEERWLYLLERGGCVPALPTHQEIVSDTTLVSSAEGQVLDADTLYEARLVPLLLHETFGDNLEGWHTVGGALSDWQVRGHATLGGEKATISGAIVSLAVEAPDLSGLDPAFDHMVLKGDTARPFGHYRIVSVDNAAKRITVDGAPQLSSSPSAWEIPELGAAVTTSAVETTLARDGSGGWQDYRLSASLRPSGGQAVGLIFRHAEGGEYYRYAIDAGAGRRRLEKVSGGVASALVPEKGFEYQENVDYLVTVEAVGPALRVYENGALVFETTDDSLGAGGIGLYSAGGIGDRFADVRVDELGGPRPPAYRFGFTTSRFANFFHHAHSFDDETWRAQLAHGSALASLASAGAASVAPAPAPPPPGEAEARAYDTLAREVLGSQAAQDPPRVEITRVSVEGEKSALLVRGPEPVDWKRTRLELLRADRIAPTPSPPGDLKLTGVEFGGLHPNDESVTLLARETLDLTGRHIEYRAPLLYDAFDAAVTGRWRPWNEGDEDGPSAWEVRDGWLHQTSNVHGGDPNSPERPGTLALAGEFAWADYGLSVTLKSDDADGDIGAIFRFQDGQNYYRFSMGATPAHRRLIRKSGGVVSMLWEDTASGYVVGREYSLTVECGGGRLSGYLDGESIFEVEDTVLSEGCIGLYCWRNPAARFGEVRVVPSGWAQYYAFGEEARTPAGTRVRVYPGNASHAPPEEPNLIQRFVATGTDAGRLLLPPEGAELRLADKAGKAGHARQFLPDEAYVPVEGARLLRKADGTGFFVLGPASAGYGLTGGNYRLRLEYRRDIRDEDAGSLVLSEAGSTTPEPATLDIP